MNPLQRAAFERFFVSASRGGCSFAQLSVTGPTTLKNFQWASVNATSAPIAIALPLPLEGSLIAVTKSDASANVVSLVDTGEGTIATLTNQAESIVYRGTGAGWELVARDGQSATPAVVYSVDLAALPSHTMTPGANTLDGKIWWMKGALRNASESFALVNGAGLRWRVRELQTQYYTNNAPDTFPDGGFFGYFDFSQLRGYSRWKPTFVQYRYQDIQTQNVYFGCGLWSAAADASLPNVLERGAGPVMIVGAEAAGSPGGSSYQYAGWPGASPPIVYINQPSGVCARMVMQIAHLGIFRCQVFSGKEQASDTAWPDANFDPYDASYGQVLGLPGLPRPPNTLSGYVGHSSMPPLGFGTWFENAQAGLGHDDTRQCTLRGLRVLQPG